MRDREMCTFCGKRSVPVQVDVVIVFEGTRRRVYCSRSCVLADRAERQRQHRLDQAEWSRWRDSKRGRR